jgi:hypothetical protein
LQNSCMFLSQLLNLLSKESPIFSLLSVLSWSLEILSSTYLSMLEWLSNLFFILLRENFISRVSFLMFFLRISIFVLNSFLISCTVSFICFILPLVLFWGLLESSLSSFNSFCVFLGFFYLYSLWIP